MNNDTLFCQTVKWLGYFTKNNLHDYIRDNCLFRKEINIYDKMSAQVRYTNNVALNYSLTTYSPYEGWRVAFNGTEGRIEAWMDIPYLSDMNVNQSELHAKEMDQTNDENADYAPIIVHNLWKKHEKINVPMERAGHGGGDQRLHEKLFSNPDMPDPYGRAAGLRDGVMSVLIGIAARKSIEAGEKIRIAELTSMKPRAKRL